MADDRLLTTIDNPYNPFTHWDDWYTYDTMMGYHTIAFLGRIVRDSEDMSEADQELAIDQAMDEIVRENVSGMHRIVVAGS